MQTNNMSVPLYEMERDAGKRLQFLVVMDPTESAVL